MDAAAATDEGEVVYLLAELRSGQEGPVHEIGSRARVIDTDGEMLTLAVVHGIDEDVVTCPRSLVVNRRCPETRYRPVMRQNVAPTT